MDKIELKTKRPCSFPLWAPTIALSVLGKFLPGNMSYSVVYGNTECATRVSVNFFTYLLKKSA